MRFRYTFYLLGAVLLCACSETKYVPEGDYLLDKVKVKSDPPTKGINPSDMKAYVRQVGNSRWFSAVKIPLATYSLSGRDTTKWINRMLRSIGEAPVLYDSASTRRSMADLQMQLVNMGYLRASVDAMTKSKKKKVDVTYFLHPGQPYYIRHVDYVVQDSAIASHLRLDLEQNRQLKQGMLFSVANLDGERKRITQLLNNLGYYRFNKEYISFEADSVGKQDIDVVLILRKQRLSNGQEAPHQRYHVRNVVFESGDREDSVIHLRQGVLHRNTYVKEGDYYSADDLQNTYNHFGRLGAVRYTNITWKEQPDSNLLDCQIQVSTNKPSTISFQPEGTNTAGDLGFAASLTYQNRNLFRGSENLSIELRGAYEAIKGLEGYSNHNFLEYSLGTKLTFPSFIAPFLSSGFRRRVNATSQVSLLYDLQNRPEFHRRVFSVGWRYRWNDPRHHDTYRLDLLDLNYISMPWISDTFKKEYLDNTTSRNAILRYNYENLFIMKFGVGYAYNNGIIAIKANAETAGNLLGLMAKSFGFHRDNDGRYTFLDVAYAQYLKVDLDVTRTINFDYYNQLVFHAGLGIAYPYGNSTILPFEKRYFSGGANSVRGWSVRSLGPGKYISRDGRIDFINQTGDMKLDFNVEYRAHLFWKLGMALFADINPAYEEGDDRFPIVHPKLSRDFAFHFAVGLPF